MAAGLTVVIKQGVNVITSRFIAAASMTASDQTFTFNLTSDELASLSDVSVTPLTATGTWDMTGISDGVEVNAMSVTLTESGGIVVGFIPFFIIGG